MNETGTRVLGIIVLKRGQVLKVSCKRGGGGGGGEILQGCRRWGLCSKFVKNMVGVGGAPEPPSIPTPMLYPANRYHQVGKSDASKHATPPLRGSGETGARF